jgi:hypothetical protein
MAIMAVAAIGSAAGIAAGVVTVSTLTMIGVGLSVVGMVTGNATLSKIGAGMGFGAAGAGLAGLGAVGATGANSAAMASQAASEAATGGGLAAAEGATAAAAPSTIGMSAATPAAQGMGGQTAASMIAEAAAPTAPALGTGVADIATAGTGLGTESLSSMGLASELPQITPTAMGGFQTADSWFDTIGNLWGGLDASGKSAVVQAGTGLVSGAAKGIMQSMSESDKLAAAQAERDRVAANMRGVPTAGIGINPNYRPAYPNAIGLINKVRV